MKIHSNIHVKRSCDDCSEEFDNKKLLNKHIQQVHIKKFQENVNGRTVHTQIKKLQMSGDTNQLVQKVNQWML